MLDGTMDYGWQSEIKVSRELDGTVNDPTNNDGGWLLEIAIPFESLGIPGKVGDRLGFTAKRCDQPRKKPRVCASATQRALVLE